MNSTAVLFPVFRCHCRGRGDSAGFHGSASFQDSYVQGSMFIAVPAIAVTAEGSFRGPFCCLLVRQQRQCTSAFSSLCPVFV